MVEALAIRTASLDDLDAVTRLDALCFARPWDRAQWRRELELEHARVLAGWVGTQLVALACVWSVTEAWELQRIAVDPARRGQGLGRDLLDRALEMAAAEGATEMWLEVARHNSAARALYAAVGFEKIAERPAYYTQPPHDALIFRKRVERSS